MEPELEVATIHADDVSNVAQPSTSDSIDKYNTKSDSKKMKPEKGEKKKEKSKKNSKKLRKKFQMFSSSSESSSSSSSTTDKDKKRSSRASKLKAKKELAVVNDAGDDTARAVSSRKMFRRLWTICITYTTKPDKGSFLTRVALKRELRSSSDVDF